MFPFIIPILPLALLQFLNFISNFKGIDFISRNATGIHTLNSRTLIWGPVLAHLAEFDPMHIVGYGLYGQKSSGVSQWFDIFTGLYNYEHLSREVFDSVINYLKGEHVSLEDRHVYAKIWVDEETGNVGRRGKMARVIYMTNIGTIPDESYVTVKIGDDIVGRIDEGFLERLKKG